MFSNSTITRDRETIGILITICWSPRLDPRIFPRIIQRIGIRSFRFRAITIAKISPAVANNEAVFSPESPRPPRINQRALWLPGRCFVSEPLSRFIRSNSPRFTPLPAPFIGRLLWCCSGTSLSQNAYAKYWSAVCEFEFERELVPRRQWYTYRAYPPEYRPRLRLEIKRTSSDNVLTHSGFDWFPNFTLWRNKFLFRLRSRYNSRY